MKAVYFFIAVFFTFSGISYANNVQISNVTIITPSANTFQLQFDLSWDNSWRVNSGPANYDGAYLFFKYKLPGGSSTWQPLPLSGSNNVVPSGFDIYQSTAFGNKFGTVIYRDASNTGMGPLSITGIKLGLLSNIGYNIDVRSFALEMVYIPSLGSTGSAYTGDGNGSTESQNAFHAADNSQVLNNVNTKVDVNGFDDAELETNGIVIGYNDTITYTTAATAAFPTFKNCWCMKYELNQGAYRDFLNTLTVLQQTTRTATAPTSAIGTGALINPTDSRNYLEIKTPASGATPAVYGCDASNNNVYDETNDGEWVACNYLTWPDLAAYLDWSGLAPMTEVQYEYFCRGTTSAGPNFASIGEFAWGSAIIFGSTYTLGSVSQTSEIATNAPTGGATGNANWNATFPSFPAGGPLRVGIFANGITNRATSGASFYGVMEMTGNVGEYCINLGSNAGRSCKYVPNGDGLINGNGNSVFSGGTISSTWPGMDGNTNYATANLCASFCEITGTAGIMVKGGNWISSPSSVLSVSYRNTAQPSLVRYAGYGGRGILLFR